MTTLTFPSLADLNRPGEILDVISSSRQGLALVSGPPCAGVSTTLTALGHDLQDQGKKVVVVRMGDDERLPGLPEVESNEFGLSLFNAVLGSDKPDVVIINEITSRKSIFFALDLVLRGVTVAAGVHANSTTDAMRHLRNIDPVGNLEQILNDALILKVHQEFVPTDSFENSRVHMDNVYRSMLLMSTANRSVVPVERDWVSYSGDRKVAYQVSAV